MKRIILQFYMFLIFSPDKRQVLLHNEKHLLAILRASLRKTLDTGHVTAPVPQSSSSQIDSFFKPPDVSSTTQGGVEGSSGTGTGWAWVWLICRLLFLSCYFYLFCILAS